MPTNKFSHKERHMAWSAAAFSSCCLLISAFLGSISKLIARLNLHKLQTAYSKWLLQASCASRCILAACDVIRIIQVSYKSTRASSRFKRACHSLSGAPTVVSFSEGVGTICMKLIKARMFIKLTDKPRFYLIPFLLLILWLFCRSGMNTACAIWIQHGCTYVRGGQGLLPLPVLLPMPF